MQKYCFFVLRYSSCRLAASSRPFLSFPSLSFPRRLLPAPLSSGTCFGAAEKTEGRVRKLIIPQMTAHKCMHAACTCQVYVRLGVSRREIRCTASKYPCNERDSAHGFCPNRQRKSEASRTLYSTRPSQTTTQISPNLKRRLTSELAGSISIGFD